MVLIGAARSLSRNLASSTTVGSRMNHIRGRFFILVSLLLIPGASRVLSAQSTELWPEVDVLWQPAEHQRTMLELSMSTEHEGTKREGTVGIYQDYAWLPRGYLRGGYRYTFSIRDASYRESRLVGELVLGSNVARRLRLVNRARTELRWVNGEYSYRLRDRLHLQRMPRDSRGRAYAPYGTFEAYYDSRFGAIARLAGRVGTEMRLEGRTLLDVYIARQNNLRSTPQYVNALGMTLKLVMR
jgi:hypothetical protein